MALPHRAFEILGIMVLTVDDKQILDSTREEQFAVIHEPEIASSQEETGPGIGQSRPKGGVGLFRSVPVALGHVGTGKPHLSDAVWRTLSQGLGIDNADGLPRGLPAATDEGPAARLPRSREDHMALQQ